MTEAGWALVGVVIGSAVTAITNVMLQVRQFSHERKMFQLKNGSAEMVKATLKEMLSHKNYTDRSFFALKERIGGYSDDQVRQFLHEIGARRTSREDGSEEWWYLASRQEERNERRASRARSSSTAA